MCRFFRNCLAVLVLLVATHSVQADGPKRLLLVGQGPDGHPPKAHEYVAGLKLVQKMLEPVQGLKAELVNADEPWQQGPELLEKADGVVLYLAEGAKWMDNGAKRQEALAKFAARGGGIVVLHWAMGTREAKHIDGCLKLLGGCHGGPDRKYKILQADVTLPEPKHPIAAGIKPFAVHDEFYYQLKFAQTPAKIVPVLQVTIDGQVETVAWAWERPDKGRSFGFSGLHFHENWRLQEYRRVVAQAVLWTLQMPIPKEGLAVNIDPKQLELK